MFKSNYRCSNQDVMRVRHDDEKSEIHVLFFQIDLTLRAKNDADDGPQWSGESNERAQRKSVRVFVRGGGYGMRSSAWSEALCKISLQSDD
jgi:hypothetical protein